MSMMCIEDHRVMYNLVQGPGEETIHAVASASALFCAPSTAGCRGEERSQSMQSSRQVSPLAWMFDIP